MSSKLSTKPPKVPLEALAKRLEATISFLESRYEFPSGAAFRAATKAALDVKDSRMLRTLAAEVDKVASVTIPVHERDGLDAVLNSIGINREGERAAMAERAKNAIRRGRIASEAERQHLETYLEMLESSGEQAQEVAAVRRLLES